ncbi:MULTISPECIES: hypothetical protein [unclassified Paraflavitalea]
METNNSNNNSSSSTSVPQVPQVVDKAMLQESMKEKETAIKTNQIVKK